VASDADASQSLVAITSAALLLVTDVNSSMPNDQWQLTNVT
jgi:hypothetical protein